MKPTTKDWFKWEKRRFNFLITKFELTKLHSNELIIGVYNGLEKLGDLRSSHFNQIYFSHYYKYNLKTFTLAYKYQTIFNARIIQAK